MTVFGLSPTWLTCAICLVFAPLAHAAPLALDAELPSGLKSCISESQLAAAYQRALTANTDEARPLPLQVSMRSAPGNQPGTTVLQLTAASSGHLLGTRELAVLARDCATLPDAVGLVLALFTRDAAAVPDAPAPAPAPPPLAAAPVDTSEPPAPGQSQPSPTQHLAFGVGAGAFFGVLPSAAATLQLQAAMPVEAGERLSLRLKAGMLWPQEQRLAQGIIDARSYELSLEACSGVTLSRLVLRACAGPRAGLLYARGREFQVRNQDQREFLLYVGVLPEAALRLTGQTWLQLTAGGALALVRPRFEVGVERESGVVDRLSLGNPGLFRAELSMSVVQIF